MSFLAFDARHRLGNPEIDRQHAAPFAMVDRLHDLITPGQGLQALARLSDLLREEALPRFRRREDLAQRGASPGLLEHERIHDWPMLPVRDLEAKQGAGSLQTFLKDWLGPHIVVEDRRRAELLGGYCG